MMLDVGPWLPLAELAELVLLEPGGRNEEPIHDYKRIHVRCDAYSTWKQL